jgi:lactose/L-arabinose transport system permease protein
MRKIVPYKFFLYGFLVIAGFVSIFPFYWMVSGATNKSIDIIRGKMFFETNLIENFKILFQTIPMGMGFLNSLRNTVIGTLASLLICSMAGYGFQIYRSKGKDRLMFVLLLSMMIPFASIMVPLFRLISSLRLLNTTIGIILPGISTAFLIFFFRQCSQSFPMEIVQAARVDGLVHHKA